MRCPRCGYEHTQIEQTRFSGIGSWNRRSCPQCQLRFTTYEYVVPDSLPMVVSQDGRRERFDPAVLEEALRSACENRPIAPIQIQSILAHVIAQVTSMGEDELPSRQIAQWVLDELQPLDQVAFIRFASAYLRERAPDESGEHTRTSPS